jgi:hypothetical protein
MSALFLMLALTVHLLSPAAAGGSDRPSEKDLSTSQSPAPGFDFFPPAGGFLNELPYQPEVSRHTVEAVNIQAHHAQFETRVHPETIKLTILGSAAQPAVPEMELRERITAYIAVDRLKPGVYVKPAKIRLPDGFALIDASPEIFVVEIAPGENGGP